MLLRSVLWSPSWRRMREPAEIGEAASAESSLEVCAGQASPSPSSACSSETSRAVGSHMSDGGKLRAHCGE